MFIEQPRPNSQKYRSDIDGLRAIAVLSVILFHINPLLLPGGFVGVDIFFVISGYLISLHIYKELENGQFSLAEFYRRRIKRIAPAMLVVLGITVILAQFILLPEDAEKVAESGLWSLASMANVYFWLFQDTSYFAAASNELPLLHLWSLGVEEQFYIFWPLLLMLVYRSANKPVFALSILVIALLSFVLGETYFAQNPSFVYYMLPTRAGELLVGALVALAINKNIPAQLSLLYRSLLASAGVTLLVASFVLLSEESVFPGYQAIPPTMGVALLIFVGHYGKNWTSPFLTLVPMQWVGLISYSAYLWHWPILAFYRYGQFDIHLLSGSVILTSTLLLAWLTYKYVEQPLRKTSYGALQVFIRQYCLPAGALALLAVLAMKLDGYGVRWFSEDYKNSLSAAQQHLRYRSDYDYVCMRKLVIADDVIDAKCILGQHSGSEPKILLWGDSNAAHFVDMLAVFAEDQSYQFRNIEVSACPPLLFHLEKHTNPKRLTECMASQKIIQPILETFDTLFIAASWTTYTGNSEQFIDDFKHTLDLLSTQVINIIVIGKTPHFTQYNRYCKPKQVSFPLMNCNVSPVALDQNTINTNDQLATLAKNYNNIHYTDFNKFLCPEGLCSVYLSSELPLYFDKSHMSQSGSQFLGEMILRTHGTPQEFTTTELYKR